MFNGLVNLHDFVVLARKLRSSRRSVTIAKLFSSGASRVKHSWQHTDTAPVHWWNVPAVHERWNRLITGDPSIPYQTYVYGRYLASQHSITGLSLGCGIGLKEEQWVRSCPNLHLTGTDISEQRIAQAASNAASQGLQEQLQFRTADIHTEEHPDASLDLIIADGSLHHFHSLHHILPKLSRWLKKDGLFIVNDYVGPARFQWSDRQLDTVNAALKMIPDTLRTELDGSIKKKVYRPGRLSMIISDPSEAVESDRIDAALHRYFRIKERTPYGGMLLQNVLKGIAHHFVESKGPAAEVLLRLFQEEDRIIASGELTSDFCFYVCTKKG
jgi:ubiquinone/menaquinone biosynthesis C-methylase UbiE